MKPEYMENLVSCPYCGRMDNVALVSGDIGLMWCACGKVFKLYHEDHMVKEYLLIHDMD